MSYYQNSHGGNNKRPLSSQDSALKVLGLVRISSCFHRNAYPGVDEVKSAFKKLALRHHPDKQQQPPAASRTSYSPTTTKPGTSPSRGAAAVPAASAFAGIHEAYTVALAEARHQEALFGARPSSSSFEAAPSSSSSGGGGGGGGKNKKDSQPNSGNSNHNSNSTTTASDDLRRPSTWRSTTPAAAAAPAASSNSTAQPSSSSATGASDGMDPSGSSSSFSRVRRSMGGYEDRWAARAEAMKAQANEQWAKQQDKQTRSKAAVPSNPVMATEVEAAARAAQRVQEQYRMTTAAPDKPEDEQQQQSTKETSSSSSSFQPNPVRCPDVVQMTSSARRSGTQSTLSPRRRYESAPVSAEERGASRTTTPAHSRPVTPLRHMSSSFSSRPTQLPSPIDPPLRNPSPVVGRGAHRRGTNTPTASQPPPTTTTTLRSVVEGTPTDLGSSGAKLTTSSQRTHYYHPAQDVPPPLVMSVGRKSSGQLLGKWSALVQAEVEARFVIQVGERCQRSCFHIQVIEQQSRVDIQQISEHFYQQQTAMRTLLVQCSSPSPAKRPQPEATAVTMNPMNSQRCRANSPLTPGRRQNHGLSGVNQQEQQQYAVTMPSVVRAPPAPVAALPTSKPVVHPTTPQATIPPPPPPLSTNTQANTMHQTTATTTTTIPNPQHVDGVKVYSGGVKNTRHNQQYSSSRGVSPKQRRHEMYTKTASSCSTPTNCSTPRNFPSSSSSSSCFSASTSAPNASTTFMRRASLVRMVSTPSSSVGAAGGRQGAGGAWAKAAPNVASNSTHSNLSSTPTLTKFTKSSTMTATSSVVPPPPRGGNVMKSSPRRSSPFRTAVAIPDVPYLRNIRQQ